MSDANTPPKPTLLAFHGSGSNATIHTVQLARLNRVLKPHFNIEPLEAPFPSPAGPGVLPFFDGCGPFARWLPPAEKVSVEIMCAGTSTPELSKEVEKLVREAVQRVTTGGGRVVGLVGFSQGTKVVAGLLRGAQIRREVGARGEDWLASFHFALSVCSSYAPPLLPLGVLKLPEVQGLGEEEREALKKEKIAAPVLHVLGEQDEWRWAGEGLIKGHFEVADGKSKVEVWDMGHHYPQKPEESEQMKDWLVEQLRILDGGKDAAA
ncbi:serine hydrolase FSH [Boeremia exigua]|uniref:serine hydrolase FSH n=1 Tax=Boeremia exigua TaxID=749465 RepID=UPI001E8D0292|nr:serine hydrolase FSH [Boeremia exigua]KAH6633152.1 serine hydrolase FSH [Boeremia exigua]